MPRAAEVWKGVPEYPEYEVSSWGRMRSYTEPKYMRLKGAPKGRQYVSLCRQGKQKDFLVHRLVLRAFVGEPRPGQEACHNDGNPANNCLNNLRWDTHVANERDKYAHGTRPCGAQHWKVRLTAADAQAIKAELAQGQTNLALATRYGVNPATISNIKQGKHWTERTLARARPGGNE